MPLCKEVGLGPGHIVLDGDPKVTQPPQQPLSAFGPCLLWPNGRPSQQLLSSFLLGNSSSKTFDGREIELTGNCSHSALDALMPLLDIVQRFIARETLASAGIGCRHVSVCLSIRPSVTSRCSTETA